MTIKESILEVLDREPIRLSDGRYSVGFADTIALKKLIDMDGYVDVYEIRGVKFVRKNIRPVASKQ